MIKIPRNHRFLTQQQDEKEPFDMCQLDTDKNRLIFTRVVLVSKKPFIVRIMRVEKEVVVQ